jgi:hypothetical protein
MLGTKVVDRVSGFTGIVTGRALYIDGDRTAQVTPKVDAGGGAFVEPQWFNEKRLQVVSTEPSGMSPEVDDPAIDPLAAAAAGASTTAPAAGGAQ